MAVTIGQKGELKSAADLLAPEFIRYRALIRRDRRRRYLGWAALAVSIVWLALAMLNFFNLASPSMILGGVGLTLLIPGSVLLYEASRAPTLAQTAVSLDRLLDNRQRMITSVELLASGVEKPITDAQLASSAGILERVNPRKLYPARMPLPQLVLAGGLLLLAIGLFIVKGLGDGKALQASNLPSGPNTAQAVPSSTPHSSLPGAAPQQQSQSQQQPQPGQSLGTPVAGGTQSNGAVSPQQAQQQAADSREAQKALQRLAQALDQQSVTQAAADAIRQGDYNGAANDLTDLGKNNDQLSDQAKKSMAAALSGAATDSSAAPQLQNAEQNAANALNQGDYAVTSDALNALAQAIKDTGSQVIPQQDLSKDFPDQNGQQGQQGQNGKQNGQSGQNGQQSQQDQNGQQGQQGQNSQDNQNGQNGQQDQNGQSGQNGQNDQNSQQNQQGHQDQQGNQDGGTGNLPGEGSQVQGPAANKLNVPGNPFVIDGNPDPNANKPGDGKSPPAMTLNGSPGGSTQETAPSQGGPVTANGENNSPPASRWGIVQKYFGGGSQQSQQNSQSP